MKLKPLLFFLFLTSMTNVYARMSAKWFDIIIEVYSMDKTKLKGYEIKYDDSTYITDADARIKVKLSIAGYDLSIKRRKMLNGINPKYLVFEYGSYKYFLKNNWRKILKGKCKNKVYKIYFPILFRK